MPKYCHYFFFVLTFFSLPLTGREKEYELSATAIFRDEAPYIKEWIEFHRLVGVEHFYLYNHLSNDHPEKVLAPYIEAGIVELQNVNKKGDNLLTWNRIQSNAYTDAIERSKKKSRWLAVIDLDEFIVPMIGRDIPSILKEYHAHGAVALNWQLFGTSNVEKVQENELMCEKLTHRAPTDYGDNKYVKLILNPSITLKMKGPHTCTFSIRTTAVNTDFTPVPAKQSPKVCVDKLQINHYWCKDMHFFREVKMKRNKNMGTWLDHMTKRLEALNQVEDTSMSRFIPELTERVFSDSVYFD